MKDFGRSSRLAVGVTAVVVIVYGFDIDVEVDIERNLFVHDRFLEKKASSQP